VILGYVLPLTFQLTIRNYSVIAVDTVWSVPCHSLVKEAKQSGICYSLA